MRTVSNLARGLALISGLQFFFAAAPVNAHAPVIPPVGLGHAAAASNAFKALLLHRKLAPVPISGTGSATVRLNSQTLRTLIGHGFANGQSVAINQQVGGAISNGNLSGVLYFDSYGGAPGYGNLGETYIFAIGSNPYNSGVVGFQNGTTSSANALSFGASSIFKQHNAGATFPYNAGTSGAERAQTALYKSLSSASTAAGEKSIKSYGSITGGELSGAFGFEGRAGSNAPYYNYANAVYAFGNNPYNSTAIASFPAAALGNYITFTNGTRLVTGGQLAFTVLNPSAGGKYLSYGYYGLAFGNSPFNKTVLSIPYSSIKNVINFAAIK